jgi:hypothetical protein
MLRTGIITIYLSLRLLVIRGFLNVYPGRSVPTRLADPLQNDIVDWN